MGQRDPGRGQADRRFKSPTSVGTLIALTLSSPRPKTPTPSPERRYRPRGAPPLPHAFFLSPAFTCAAASHASNHTSSFSSNASDKDKGKSPFKRTFTAHSNSDSEDGEGGSGGEDGEEDKGSGEGSDAGTTRTSRTTIATFLRTYPSRVFSRDFLLALCFSFLVLVISLRDQLRHPPLWDLGVWGLAWVTVGAPLRAGTGTFGDFLEIVSSYRPGFTPFSAAYTTDAAWADNTDFCLSVSLPTLALTSAIPTRVLVASDRRLLASPRVRHFVLLFSCFAAGAYPPLAPDGSYVARAWRSARGGWSSSSAWGCVEVISPLGARRSRRGGSSGCWERTRRTRFPPMYPIGPPFFRIITPRFLPFMHSGSGHVTGDQAHNLESGPQAREARTKLEHWSVRRTQASSAPLRCMAERSPMELASSLDRRLRSPFSL
ncbi:hypothetical protein DFH07DRAFT_935435 [Mycena maculata]|uniref:Uncharacterized protein n=1 Tax=Mycena maculata TaxID=230809 RepID=A0AAD7NZR0_9AGAR|nr:hypothetical protein DFH07DRAFT_935435 [Mycena maculata]